MLWTYALERKYSLGRKGRRRETDLKFVALVPLRKSGGNDRRTSMASWVLIFPEHRRLQWLPWV